MTIPPSSLATHGRCCIAACSVVLAVLTAACATVPPHARGRLAQPDMALDADPDLLGGQQHADEYREGAAGGFGAAGGGCGCN